jgi:hypothetical protein
MQEAQWFSNQIIKPSNLNFMNDSTGKNVKDVVVAFTKGQPGAVSGLIITGSGGAVANVTTGFAFTSDGERIQLFSPSGIAVLPFSGSTSIFANLITVNYNPDPSQNPALSANVASGLNAGSLDYEVVEQYNLLGLTTISGATYVKLGDVVTNGGLITSIDYTNRQNLKVGEIDLFSNSIDGNLITAASIDSDQFVSPLHYDIALNSGVSIDYLGSGINHMASMSNPLGNIYAVSGTFHDISGFSPISIDSLVQKSGTSLESNSAHVTIDTANIGTKIGGGMVVDKNSIDLTEITGPTPSDANLTITTPNTASVDINSGAVNINAPLNVGAGGLTVTAGDITLTGGGKLNVPFFTVTTLGINGAVSGSNTLFQGSIAVSGNMISSGTLAFGDTEQQFENIIPNGLMYPNVANISGTNIPNVWTAINPDVNYVIGPLGTPLGSNPNLQIPLGASGLAFFQGRSEFTFEFVFKSPITGGKLNRLITFNNTSRLETIAATKSLFWGANVGNAAVVTTPSNVIQNNVWSHAAITRDSNNVATIWVDGINRASGINASTILPSSITFARIGASDTDASASIDDLYLKAFKISNKAKSAFPSGLCNLTSDSDTVALYNFNVIPSGINSVPASGLGNLITYPGLTLGFYEAPSGTYTIGSQFLGQSLSGSSVLDYTKDTKPVGTVNVFSGATNSPYYFQVSGNNITSAGLTFSTPLNVENSKEYNISYFTKLISGSSVALLPSNTIGIKAYVSGTNYVSSIFTGSNSSSEWTRNSFDFRAPATGENFNLYINTYSSAGNTISGTSLIGLSSVQATRGAAKLEVLNSGPKMLTLTHPILNQDLQNSNYPVNQGYINYFSGNIFSNGGLASIQPQLHFLLTGAPGGARYYMFAWARNIVTLNGNLIINEVCSFFDNAVVNGGVLQYGDFNFTRHWNGYLNHGANMLVSTLYLNWNGGINDIPWRISPFNSDTTGNLGINNLINVPQTDIIMY